MGILTVAERAALDTIQRKISIMNENHGFHEAATYSGAYLPDYWIRKAALCVTESAEAIEEIRSGHDAAEIYYREDGKPEGFVVELIDMIIRGIDLVDEASMSLSEVLEEKLAFNEGRAFKHGRNF